MAELERELAEVRAQRDEARQMVATLMGQYMEFVLNLEDLVQADRNAARLRTH